MHQGLQTPFHGRPVTSTSKRMPQKHNQLPMNAKPWKHMWKTGIETHRLRGCNLNSLLSSSSPLCACHLSTSYAAYAFLGRSGSPEGRPGHAQPASEACSFHATVSRTQNTLLKQALVQLQDCLSQNAYNLSSGMDVCQLPHSGPTVVQRKLHKCCLLPVLAPTGAHG